MSHITTLQENRPILQEIFNVQATVGRKKDAHKLQNLEQRRAWEDEMDKTTSGDDFSHLKCKINKIETKNEVITTCQWLSQSKRVQFTVIHKPRAPRSPGAYQVRLVLCCFDGIVNWGLSFSHWKWKCFLGWPKPSSSCDRYFRFFEMRLNQYPIKVSSPICLLPEDKVLKLVGRVYCWLIGCHNSPCSVIGFSWRFRQRIWPWADDFLWLCSFPRSRWRDIMNNNEQCTDKASLLSPISLESGID